jgi:transposase
LSEDAQLYLAFGTLGASAGRLRYAELHHRLGHDLPPKANRVWKNCFSPFLYRTRNAIERMFCRLKDFRRIATRYDRLATNFLAAICLAATVSYWL